VCITVTCNEILVQYNLKSYSTVQSQVGSGDPGQVTQCCTINVQFLRKFDEVFFCQEYHCYSGGWRPHQDTTTGGAHTCEQIMDAGVEQPGQGAGAYSWRTVGVQHCSKLRIWGSKATWRSGGQTLELFGKGSEAWKVTPGPPS